MNPADYFRDLSKEFRAVQNRIRNLIGDAHWPSDGAWKESVLRTVLRRYPPPSFTVGTGFILTPEGPSTQVDILLCDDSAPLLFRDGDFLVCPGDCVRAAVEVKTQLPPRKLHEALSKLDEVSALLRRRCIHPPPFLGLFSYEPITSKPTIILDTLQQVNGQSNNYVIQALSFGDSQYYEFWDFDPQSNSRQPYDSWVAYNLPDCAPGYFLHSLILFLFPHAAERARKMWFPEEMNQRAVIEIRKRKDR